MQPTRKFSRYRLGAPVNFSWKDPQGVLQEGKGFARDLSAGGVFLLTRTSPPVGVPITFELFLPALASGAQPLRLQGEARVVRVETALQGQGGQWDGFAAVNRRFALWDMERKFPRHRVEIPVIFSWRDERGRRQRTKGFARDLSAGGGFFVTRKSPPVGVPIAFEAFLPPLGPGAPPLRMKGEGRVLRVEVVVEGEGEQWDGFAAVNESVVLHDLE